MRRIICFLLAIAGLVGIQLEADVADSGDWIIETVVGPVPAREIGLSLEHEHVLVDFVGAAHIEPGRYDPDEVVAVALPHLRRAVANGVKTVFECTPAFIGRDPLLLRRLSEETGIRFVTNTGLYGAANDKFVPAYAYQETAEQLAERWIAESRSGIEGTGIKPGFIKSAVDRDPVLSDIDRKLIEAAALAHRETGLTIAVHTGPGPGLAIIKILGEHGVAPNAFVWVHAHGGKNDEIIAAAKAGAWISLDGLRPGSLERHVEAMMLFKKEDLLEQVLLSHDAGWFDPTKPDGGDFRGYEFMFNEFLPELRELGFTDKEIRHLLEYNVAEAFGIRPRLKPEE